MDNYQELNFSLKGQVGNHLRKGSSESGARKWASWSYINFPTCMFSIEMGNIYIDFL